MSSSQIKQQLEGACKAVDLTMVDYKVKPIKKGRVWQIVINKADGQKATIDDCVSAHRQILSVLQVADVYGDHDEIEVSSSSDDPGAWD